MIIQEKTDLLRDAGVSCASVVWLFDREEESRIARLSTRKNKNPTIRILYIPTIYKIYWKYILLKT